MDLTSGWYPHDKISCESEIKQYLEEYNLDLPDHQWHGGIVPHAGWYYSGKLACQVIQKLSMGKNIDIVIIFGGHLRKGDNVIYYDFDQFETPLGNIYRENEVFNIILDRIKEFSSPEYTIDNTVEIQLPFIKYFMPETPIIAFRSPPSSLAKRLGCIIAEEMKNRNMNGVFIGSTDLTHYGPNYGFTSHGMSDEALQWVKYENDKLIIDYFLSMDEDSAINHALKESSACSVGGAIACMEASRVMGSSKGHLVDYYTSYDVRKDDSFVGYAGVIY